MPRRHTSTCPSGKVRYSDKLAAKLAMTRARGTDRGEQRVYRCGQCHGYHLTSTPRK